MKNACFDHLSSQRDFHLAKLGHPRSGRYCQTNATTGKTQCPYRVLFAGVSNSQQIWLSIGKDDIKKMWDGLKK